MKKYFQQHPLALLIFLGLAVRILAAVFSKGFLTLDDHHNLVVDADMLASGIKLPLDYKDSVLYPYLVSLVMNGMRMLGNTSPDVEMLAVRLFQAVVSIAGIYFVYKIIELKAGEDAAKLGGFLMSLFFIIPVTAVHQFEESFCQLPLLASIWCVARAEREAEKEQVRFLSFIGGIAMGIALILRFPMISFVAPFTGLLLLIPSTRKTFTFFVFGLIVVIGLQSWDNVAINAKFGYSFLMNYGFLFSTPDSLLVTSGGYPAGPWYRYALTLLGIFIPPFSILFFIGVARGGKEKLLYGIPTICFLIAHSLIVNKQERFLLPLIPVLIILAAFGFSYLKEWFEKNNAWWRAYKGIWVFFIVLNFLLLAVSLFHYGKKDRVEPLVYVQQQRNATGIVFAEFSYTFFVPDYYLGRPLTPYIELTNRNSISSDMQKLNTQQIPFNYCILYSDNIEEDKQLLERSLGKNLLKEKEISPSLGDWLANKLNPKYNKSKTAVVYRLETSFR